MNSHKAIKQLNKLKKYESDLRLAAEWNKPWQILISTILSARSRDEKTIEISNKLYKKYPKIENLANARLSDVQKIIRGINYYKTKSKNIINCSKILVKKYNKKVPRDFDKLLELPGVGRKTANVFLAVLGKEAIGVDTHVGSISRELGWTKNTKPEKVENDLKKLFPKKKWRSINYILVRFGRTYRGKKRKDILDEVRKTN